MKVNGFLQLSSETTENTQTFKEETLKTSTEYSETPSFFDIDLLFRINQSPDDPTTYNIVFRETATFMSNLQNLFQKIIQLNFENQVLRTFVKNLWKNYQYQQEYISFLLGNYSKEDFMELAKEYAEPFQETTDKGYLTFAGGLARSVLPQPLTSYDLSLLLNIDCSCIEQNLELIDYTSHSLESK